MNTHTRAMPIWTISDLRTGDLLFLRGVSCWSWAIQLWTTSVFSHVGMVVRFSDVDGVFVIESKELIGVQCVPIENWLRRGGKVDWYALCVADENSDCVRGVMRQRAVEHWRRGVKYASKRQFLRSFGLLTRRIAKFFGWNPDTDPDRMHCAEFAADIIDYCVEELKIPAPQWSPGQLALLRFVQRRGRVHKDCSIGL